MLVSLCSKNVQKLKNNEYFLQNGKSIGIVQKEQKQEVDVMCCCIRCVWYCTISLQHCIGIGTCRYYYTKQRQ